MSIGPLSPVAKTRTKYSNQGGYSTTSFRSLGLPPSVVNILVSAANHSLSHNTWRTYR